MESFISKIKESVKKRIEKRIAYYNIVGKLIKNKLNVNVGEESKSAIAELVRTNVSKIAKDKAKDIIYNLIKEKVQSDIKKGLAEYTVQKSKEFLTRLQKKKFK